MAEALVILVRAGYGVIIKYKDKIKEISGGYNYTTITVWN